MYQPSRIDLGCHFGKGTFHSAGSYNTILPSQPRLMPSGLFHGLHHIYHKSVI